MNTATNRKPQETRSGRELQAEKRLALAAVRSQATERELEREARDVHALWELAVRLLMAQREFTDLRRRFRSKAYPAPELAEFGTHVLDLLSAIPELPVHRAIGASFSAFNSLEKIQIERGIEPEFRYKRPESSTTDTDAICEQMKRTTAELRSALDEDDDEKPVGQPVGPSPREVERALFGIQFRTEQEEAMDETSL